MKRWMGMPVAAVLVLTACVTINVYFPAAEAKEAAKQFVEKVIGDEVPQTAPKHNDGNDGGGMAARNAAPALLRPSILLTTGPSTPASPTLRTGFDPLMLVGIGTAYAQGQPDITIKTPAVQAIWDRMIVRFQGQLRVHFDSGVLGFSRDGTIVVRDAGKVPLKDRVTLSQLVAEHNRDRNAVYREIAVANGHPEWEAQIREVFAKQWIESSRSGWWYQDASGGWKQK